MRYGYLTEEEFDAMRRKWVRGGVDRKRAVVGVQASEKPGAAPDSPPSRVRVKPVSNPAPSPSSQKFFIGCRLPGMNDITAWARSSAGKWNKYAEMKVLYQSMIKADIKAAKLKPITTPVQVFLHWVEPNAKRDYDNIRAGVKFILDALVAQKILQDDTREQVIGFHDSFSVDKHKPGVWVTLEYL